jgi:hypothetical protein
VRLLIVEAKARDEGAAPATGGGNVTPLRRAAGGTARGADDDGIPF